MAKSKLINYIELSSLGQIFAEKYNNAPSVRDVIDETGLPPWLVYELAELGYIGGKAVGEKALACLSMAMYCMKSHRFIGNGLNRLSSKQRKFLIDTRNLSSLEKWIRSRVESLKTADKRIWTSQIFREVRAYFPYLEDDDIKKVKRIVESQKRAYRRQSQKLKSLP